MILGALYSVSILLTIILWARVDSDPIRELNVWRFFLVEASVIGLLVIRHQPWSMYLLAFLYLSIYVGAHMWRSFDALRRLDRPMIEIKYGAVIVTYWAFALFMHTKVSVYTPLVIILCGVFFTYTPLGRRLWVLQLRF